MLKLNPLRTKNKHRIFVNISNNIEIPKYRNLIVPTGFI